MRSSNINNLKVSIVIPCYNEKYNVIKTIKSIEKQTFKNYEIIVVDDGSTDDTLQILKGYSKNKPYIKIVEKEHSGKADTLNRGIDEATYDLIVFMDSDSELLTENSLENLIKYYLEEKKKDGKVVACTAMIVPKGNSNLIERVQTIEYLISFFNSFTLSLYSSNITLPGPLSLIEKEIVKSFRFNKCLTEDTDLAHRLISKGYKIKVCPYSIVLTKIPRDFCGWIRQRNRWYKGIFESLDKNINIKSIENFVLKIYFFMAKSMYFLSFLFIILFLYLTIPPIILYSIPMNKETYILSLLTSKLSVSTFDIISFINSYAFMLLLSLILSVLILTIVLSKYIKFNDLYCLVEGTVLFIFVYPIMNAIMNSLVMLEYFNELVQEW